MIPRHLSVSRRKPQDSEMLRWLRQRAETGRRAEELYGSVVTAARQPAFYDVLGVPDTPAGRFELVVLHLYLALEAQLGAEIEAVRQRAIEAFVVDMDDCMREMGVGDITVPKKVKRAAAAFYERATIYHRDLSGPDPASLVSDLKDRLWAGNPSRGGAAEAMARYVRGASAALSARNFDEWVRSGAAKSLLDASLSNIRMTVT
jgi:cytochrome b pre-mRNA-processing protein 3